MPMKEFLIVFVLFCFGFTAHANGGKPLETRLPDTSFVRVDTFPSAIKTQIIDKTIQFEPVIRPLVPIPGGRQAYFTYLWDFGDGNFSTAESPLHQYEKPGEYDVSLYVVNNYDNGPRPRKPKTRVKIDANMAVAQIEPLPFEKNFFKSNGIFQLFKNADAVPGEDMSLVVGVKPTQSKGKILILTNEKLINPNGFLVANQSRYNNESVVPVLQPDDMKSMWAHVSRATITQSGSPDYGLMEELEFQGNEAEKYFDALLNEYKSISLYEIDGDAGDAQFSLINLDITPEMLADTNAIVTITGIYLADGGDPVIHKLDVPVVTSHDPNKMSVRPALLDYRLQMKKKDLTYKVQFQNDGEGDAKVIRLEMFFPKEVDVNSFELLNLYPFCDTCANPQDLGCYTLEIPEENKIIFTFKGIALPGTASPLVTDVDSTKGFIRFKLKTHKKLQNQTLSSYTDIYFDKNDPIRTNRSALRFRPGISPILMLGLNAPMKAPDDKIGKLTHGYSIGVGIAPIAPYKKPYWQVELNASTFGTEYTNGIDGIKGEVQVPRDGQMVSMEYHAIDTLIQKDYLALQIPLQIRYNLNRYVSIGVGALAKTNLNLDSKETLDYHVTLANGNDEIYTFKNALEKEERSKISFSPLVDLNIGRAYLGPAFGIRYHFDKTYKNQLNLYLMWRL